MFIGGMVFQNVRVLEERDVTEMSNIIHTFWKREVVIAFVVS